MKFVSSAVTLFQEIFLSSVRGQDEDILEAGKDSFLLRKTQWAVSFFVCLMYFTFQFEIADLSFFLVFTFFSQ